MKTIVLAAIAAGILAGPAAAQTAAGNANAPANPAGGFTAKNVDPIHPFGSINTYNVGVDAARVSAWAKTLSSEQRQDRKSTRLNSSHIPLSRMPSSA